MRYSFLDELFERIYETIVNYFNGGLQLAYEGISGGIELIVEDEIEWNTFYIDKHDKKHKKKNKKNRSKKIPGRRNGSSKKK